MKLILHLAVLGCNIVLIEAGSFKWSGQNDGNTSPAVATTRADGQYLLPVAAPAPTSPPELKRFPFGKRASTVPGSVCGYLSHDIASPLACATDNTCIFTTSNFEWNAGCCPTTSTDCPVFSTCVDSSVGASLGIASIGISTYWCSEEEFPVCVTLTYEDLVGYTIYNCGGSEVITLQAIDHSLAASSTEVTTTSSEQSSESSTSRSSSTSTSTAGPTVAVVNSSHKSTPVGAIVGAAVGGAAVLALIGLGVFFIYRKTRKTKTPVVPVGNNNNNNNNSNASQGQHFYNPDAAAAFAAYSAQPAMQQQQYSHGGDGGVQSGYGGYDDRNSMQKPPYSIQTHSIHGSTLSSPDSPPPPQSVGSGNVTSFTHSYHSPSPPPTENAGFSPTESKFHSSQGNITTTRHTTVHEMSSTKSDGQLRELE